MTHEITSMMPRQMRLRALEEIQKKNQQSPPIIATADVTDSIIGFAKGVFSSLYDSVRAQWDSNSPVMSILNLFAVGWISSRNIYLGMLIGIAESVFGINLETVFNKIKGFLTPHLSSKEAQEKFAENPDPIITTAVNGALQSEIKMSPEEAQKKLEEEVSKPSVQAAAYINLHKQGFIKDAAPPGSGLMSKLPDKNILAKWIGPFLGVFKHGIFGVFWWIVKVLLAGGGIIAVTGALASIVGAKKLPSADPEKTTEETVITEPKEEMPEAPPTDDVRGKLEPPSGGGQTTGSKSQRFMSALIASNANELKNKHQNNAPDDPNAPPKEGQKQWVVPNKSGDFADVIVDWALSFYSNISDVLQGHHKTEDDLYRAAKNVVNKFTVANESLRLWQIRIPSSFTTVEQIVKATVEELMR